ncbi:MAG: (d)CMP kinase [Christensenellales bacterium]
MAKHFSIAIDGPAGAGKSTAAKAVAQQLQILYLDTGAMYRTIGLGMLKNGVDIHDHDAVCAMLPALDVRVAYEEGVQHIFLNEEDVTDQIRTMEVSNAASQVAVIPQVRLKLVELQREIAKGQSIVMDGRDIGTYVLPDAEYKFFITATPAERAKRRYLELKEKGETRPVNEIEAEIVARDENDSSRSFAPLKQACDAMLLDTTSMRIDEVIQFILRRVNK